MNRLDLLGALVVLCAGTWTGGCGAATYHMRGAGTAFFYGEDPPVDQLLPFPQVVLEPETATPDAIQQIKQRGSTRVRVPGGHGGGSHPPLVSPGEEGVDPGEKQGMEERGAGPSRLGGRISRSTWCSADHASRPSLRGDHPLAQGRRTPRGSCGNSPSTRRWSGSRLLPASSPGTSSPGAETEPPLP